MAKETVHRKARSSARVIVVPRNELDSTNEYAKLMAKFGIVRIVFLESEAAFAAQIQRTLDGG